MKQQYENSAVTRADTDALAGPALIEFGTNWCGHCSAAQTFIEDGLATQPALRHLKIEDGPGRPLGRSFRVKLWPTLIFLRDGREVARVVRPGGGAEIASALAAISAAIP